MKKKDFIVCSLFVVAILIVLFVAKIFSNEYPDNEKLYKLSVNYLIENDECRETNCNRYKYFVDYKGFGTSEDEKYRYAYMWIYDQSYYVNEKNNIIAASGSSMAYKFIIDKLEDKVIDTELPEDGGNYTSSIKKMFPKSVARKILNFEWGKDTLEEQVKEYYKDLKDTSIKYSDNDISFVAKVLSYKEGKLLVEVLYDALPSFKKGDKVDVTVDDYEVRNVVYQEGMRLDIVFDGTIDESNPPQIHTTNIGIVG